MGQKKPILLILITAILSTLALSQETTLYMLHTNNTNGALENCYCPDHPFGAVEKRSLYIDDFITENSNTILLDAGDIFTLTHQSLKDSLMAIAYSKLPYDGILLGDQEMTLEPQLRKKYIEMMDIPVVGSNIEGKPNSSMIINRNGINIAVFGVMDPYAIRYYPESIRERIELEDPVEYVQKELKKLKDKADVVVLLTHQGADLDHTMAEAFEGIDVIIGGHSQSNLEKPETVNGTLVAQAGKEGYYIGVIKLQLKDKEVVERSGWIDTMKFEMPDDPDIMRLIEEYEKKSGRVNHQKLRMKGEKH